MLTTNQLKITYLSKYEKIFAIQKTKKQTELPSLIYTSDNAKKKFQCDICNNYDENEIYLQTDFGLTTKYNLYKNTWINLLIEEYVFLNEPHIWFDDNDSNILYMSLKTSDEFTLQFIDFRNNKKQWNFINLVHPYENILNKEFF